MGLPTVAGNEHAERTGTLLSREDIIKWAYVYPSLGGRGGAGAGNSDKDVNVNSVYGDHFVGVGGGGGAGWDGLNNGGGDFYSIIDARFGGYE